MVCRLLIVALLLDVASLIGALQHPAARPDPEVLTDVLKQPQSLFNSMSSHVAELQQTLMTAQSESQLAVVTTRDLYDQKLKEQQARNMAVTQFNQDVATRITNSKAENEQLRARAGELKRQCHAVRVDLDELRANVSLAQEFMDRALNDSQVSLTESTKLSILAELEQEAINSSERQQHEGRLDEIMLAGKAAMVQLGVREQQFGTKSEHPIEEVPADAPAVKAMPQELLQKLLSSWDSASTEQKSRQASLKETFEKEFQAGEEKYPVLLQEQLQLNTTIAEQDDLNQKLTAAVEYLEQMHKQLMDERTSVRQFARRLSNRPVPATEYQPQPPATVPSHLLATSKSKSATVAVKKPALKKAAPTKAKKQ